MTQRNGCEYTINVIADTDAPYAEAQKYCRKRGEGVFGYFVTSGASTTSGGPSSATFTRDQTFVDRSAGTKTTITSSSSVAFDSPTSTHTLRNIEFICGGAPSDATVTTASLNAEMFRTDCRSIEQKAGAATSPSPVVKLDTSAPPGQWGCYQVGARVPRCVRSEECEVVKPAGASKCRFVPSGFQFNGLVKSGVSCVTAFDRKAPQLYSGGPAESLATVCSDKPFELQQELQRDGLGIGECGPQCTSGVPFKRF